MRIGPRWLPWRRRLRYLDVGDLPNIPIGDDPISAVLAVVALIIALPFIVLFALALSELLILLALLPLVMLARVALLHPWTMEVVRKGELVASREAADWPATREVRAELAAAARRGEFLPKV